MKKLLLFMKKHVPVIVSLLVSGTLAVMSVWARGAITEGGNGIASRTSEATSSGVLKETAFVPPSGGVVLSPFSADVPVWNPTLSVFEVHEGEDYSCPDGNVFCVSDGRVEEIYIDDRYGLTAVISHDVGVRTLYASLSETSVKKGQAVQKGQIIAKGGDSALCEKELGAHVHFEYRINGISGVYPFASEQDS